MPEEEQKEKLLLQNSSALFSGNGGKYFDNEDPLYVREAQREVGKLNKVPQPINLTTYLVQPTWTSRNGYNTSSDSIVLFGVESSLSETITDERIIPDGTMFLADGRNQDARKNFK